MRLTTKTSASMLGVAFVTPAVVLIVVFGIIPIVRSIIFSLYRWDGMTAPVYLGLGNYAEAFLRDSVARKAIGNTLLLTFWGVLINVILGFSCANLVFGLKNGLLAELGKVLFFIPYILSFAAVGVLFSFVFSPTQLGLLNKVLSVFGFEPFPWLGNEITALPGIILVYAWKDFGFSFILYYAGLQTIPANMFQAAEIDGATRRDVIRFIKIPMLMSTTQTVVVIGVINYMLTFTIVFFLTPDGGPAKATEVMSTWFYKQSFKFYEFGYGSALAVILAAVIGILTILLRYVMRSEER